jgi:Na+/H+-dicarboxylate symporter
MLLAPIAIFTLFSNLLVNLEGEIVFSLIKFVLITILIFLFYMFFFYGMIIKMFCKTNPYTFYKDIREPVLFAFFSSSSSATIPLTLKTADNNLKIKKEISSFVVPIGATVNMDGSAIYLGLSAIFVSQLIGLDFSLHEYVIISLTATIGSIGAAGVPSVALVMMTIVFTSVGIPIEAIAIIAGIDRLLDMFRTAINVTGDLTIAKVVDSINKIG